MKKIQWFSVVFSFLTVYGSNHVGWSAPSMDTLEAGAAKALLSLKNKGDKSLSSGNTCSQDKNLMLVDGIPFEQSEKPFYKRLPDDESGPASIAPQKKKIALDSQPIDELITKVTTFLFHKKLVGGRHTLSQITKRLLLNEDLIPAVYREGDGLTEEFKNKLIDLLHVLNPESEITDEEEGASAHDSWGSESNELDESEESAYSFSGSESEEEAGPAYEESEESVVYRPLPKKKKNNIGSRAHFMGWLTPKMESSFKTYFQKNPNKKMTTEEIDNFLADNKFYKEDLAANKKLRKSVSRWLKKQDKFQKTLLPVVTKEKKEILEEYKKNNPGTLLTAVQAVKLLGLPDRRDTQYKLRSVLKEEGIFEGRKIIDRDKIFSVLKGYKTKNPGKNLTTESGIDLLIKSKLIEEGDVGKHMKTLCRGFLQELKIHSSRQKPKDI